MAGNDTITIVQGEDVDLDFTMNPVEDVTGWTTAFNLKGSSATRLVSKAGSIQDGPNGVIRVTLTDTETDVIPPGRYKYDLWKTDTGAERALALGDFVVQRPARDVTA